MSDQDTKKDSTIDASEQENSKPGKKFRLPSMNQNAPTEASKDPLNILKEIAKDKEIDPKTKEWLFNYAVTRFTNRRKMAYLSLITIVVFLGFLVLASLYDGVFVTKAGEGILASVKEVESLLIWIGGFLASIVATYYGASSFRPSS